MLLGQVLVVVLSAVNRFDAVVLQAAESAREKLRARLGFGSDGEAGLAD